MIQYTTPTFLFDINVPENVIDNIEVTFKQANTGVEIQKELVKDRLAIIDNKLNVHLSESETGKFSVGSCQVQMRVLTTDGKVLASEIARIKVEPSLSDDVLIEGVSDGEDSSYDAGYADGYYKGVEYGKAEGREEGKAEGIEEGKSIGYADGYSKGEEAGFESGKDEGFKSGYSDGFVSGESHGYEKGYADGSKGDVDTVDLNLHLTSNGTFLYAKPEDKYYENIAIEVNVQGNEQTQEKTLNIDRNGTFEVVPDEGYYLEKVTVNATHSDEDMSQLFKTTTYPIEKWHENTGFSSNIMKLECIRPYVISNMNSLFYSLRNVEKIDLSLLDMSQNTGFYSTFASCESLRELKVSSWDTSNVTTMGSMFSSCYVLQDIDVSDWDTSNVTTMGSMFQYCKLLTSLDLSNWDTSKVTGIGSMFYNCPSLRELNVSNWDTSNITYFGSLFNGCTVLNNLDLSSWDTSKVTSMSSDIFSGCQGLKNVTFGNNWGSNDQVTSIALSYARISRDSCMDLVAKLADKSHLSSSCKITLCNSTKGYLSADDLATLQSEFARKNWTVAWETKW